MGAQDAEKENVKKEMVPNRFARDGQPASVTYR